MKRRPWLALPALGIFLALGIPACSEVTTVTAVEVVSVEVMGDSTALVDETVQLTAVVRDASGAALGGRVPTWTSGNPAVAAVDSEGRVEARSVGSAEIRATVEGVLGSRTITILAAPVIQVPPEVVLFEFAAPEGTTRVQSQEIQVSNGGGGTLSGLTAETSSSSGTDSPSWLTATLDRTEAPAILSVSVDPTGLPEGNHEGEVRLRARSAANSVLTLPVQLRIGVASPILEMTPEAVGFASSVGEPPPSSQTVRVRNSGGGIIAGLHASVSYERGDTDGWLSAELNRNVTPAELRLEVDPAGLTPGAFDARVTVSSSETPQLSGEVSVRFRFGEPPPELELSPTTLALQVEEGPASIPDAFITVENRGGGTLENLSVRVTHESGSAQGWLTASLESGSAPTRIRVGFSTGNVPPGIHRAAIRVTAPDALNTPQEVSVELVVRPRASAEHSTFTVDPTSLPADGGSTAALTVRLLDTRSDPIPFGGDDVSFSTTAGTLSEVTDLGNGRYQATLTAPTSPGETRIRAFLRGEQIGEPVEVAFLPEDPPEDDPPQDDPPGDDPPGDDPPGDDPPGDDPPGDDPPGDDPPGDDPPGDDPPGDDPPGDDPPGDDPPGDDPPGDDPPEDDPPEDDPSGEPSATQSTLTAGSNPATPGASAQLTVQVRNAAGQNLGAGISVFLTTDSGDLDSASGTTDESGQFTSGLRASGGGFATVTAYLGSDDSGEVIGSVRVRIAAGGP